MPSKRLFSLLPILIFPVLSACTTPKDYRLVPLSGAKQTMTPKQVLIVCREEVRIAGQEAIVAERSRTKAEESALAACLAKAGYEIQEFAKVHKKDASGPSLHGSRVEDGWLICNYGTLGSISTVKYDAKKVLTCPKTYF